MASLAKHSKTYTCTLETQLQHGRALTGTGGVFDVDWLYIPSHVFGPPQGLDLIQHQRALLFYQNSPDITMVLRLPHCTLSTLTAGCDILFNLDLLASTGNTAHTLT